MAEQTTKILGLCGSLRKGSYNRMALNAVRELLPPGMTLDTHDLGALPLYNEDVRNENFPAPARELCEKIAAADAVLFVSPEYNYSIPGVLKNAIDWASRAPVPPFNGKPVAIIGASPGNIGTARMQYHLRQVCVFLNAYPMNKPEVMIGKANEKFDASGKLTDQPTREFIGKFLVALAAWTKKMKA